MTAIAVLRERFTFIHGDALNLLERSAGAGPVVFIDPPYTLKRDDAPASTFMGIRR